MSLCGALALAELSSMLPRTGGVYVFLRKAYGDSAAFVFGWLYLLVTTPATIGALSTFFAELLLGLDGADRRARRTPGCVCRSWPRSPSWCSPLINLLGARLGSAVQTFFTVVKVAALVVLMVASFTVAGRQLRAPGPRRAARATSAAAPRR